MFLDLKKLFSQYNNIYIKWFKWDAFVDQRYWQIAQTGNCLTFPMRYSH